MQQNRYRPIEISHLIIPLEIIYLVIIYIVLYYHRYIINCYNTVAELYSCPELSLSRVQIHSIRSTSHLIASLFLDSAAFICCHRSRLFHTLLRISDSRLSCSRFSHLLFLALRFSTSLSLISLFALALTLSYFFFLSLSRFLSLSIFPVQSLCLLFILYHETYIRIHSRVTRSYTTHETNALLLTENIRT